MLLKKYIYFIVFLMFGVCYATQPATLVLSTTFSTRDLQYYFKQAVCPALSVNSDSCKKNLYNLNMKYHFNVNNILANRLGIKSINAYKLDYSTMGVHNEQRYVSAAVLVPQLASSQIKGIVLYYHSATINKSLAPSDFDSHAGYRLDGKDLASVYASQGYIVIAPDYIGFGRDKYTFHPFILFPKSAVDCGVNALANARFLLNKANILASNVSAKLFIVGYSEGGGYALWTSKMLQDNYTNELNELNLNLIRTIGISGAYDVSNAQIPFLRNNVQDGCWRKNNFKNVSYIFRPRCVYENLYKTYGTNNKYYINSSLVTARARPVLVAYTLASYAYYIDHQNYAKYLLPEFYNLTCNKCTINGHHYDINDIFVRDNSGLTEEDITEDFHHSAVALLHPANNIYYDPVALIQSPYGFKRIFGHINIGLNNSILSFVQPSVAHDQSFINFLQSADIYKWRTKSPITLIYLRRDSIVTPLNSIMAMNNILPHSLVNNIVVNASISPFKSDFVIGIYKLPWINSYLTVGADHQTAMEPLLAVSLSQLE